MNMSASKDLDVPQEVMTQLEKLHEWSVENREESEALFMGSSIFALYALPDFVKSPTLQLFAKLGILGGVVSYFYHLDDEDNMMKRALDQTRKLWKDNLGDLPASAQVAVGVVGGAALLGISTALARRVHNRAEKAKEEGKVLPHSKRALVIGSVLGLAHYKVLRNR